MSHHRAPRRGRRLIRAAAALACLGWAACGAPAEGPAPEAPGRAQEQARDAQLRLAGSHLDRGEPEAAAAVATRMLADAPDDADALALRARARRGLDQAEGALADADHLLALDRFHRDGLAVRAWALTRLGRWEQAEKAYRERKQRSLRYDRDGARAGCRAYAEFFCETGDLARCEREGRACAALFPDPSATPDGSEADGPGTPGPVDSPG